jgi:UDP-N-acetyl-D-mannosaminuronic acid transferase (WecB/TagA/CpsF family)
MTDIPLIDFLGLPISDLDANEAASCIAARPPSAPFAYVVTPNAQHIVGLAKGAGVWRRAYRGALLRLCDGHVVQPLAKWVLGLRLPRACGSDVTLLLVRDHIRPDDAITVIGGGKRLEEALRRLYGWAELAVYNPPFGLLDDVAAQEACIDFIAAHPARYIFLTVGSPQSELLGTLAVERGGLTGTGLCVGGSLFFATDLVKRAPALVRRAGLEGLFRLLQRPRSHFRRVFIESLPVVGLLLKARFGKARILP